MTDAAAPAELAALVGSWAPEPEVVTGEIDPWPARALAALLGAPRPSYGDALPPLWTEVYLHADREPGELGEDGHPAAGALLPPLAERRRMFGAGRIDVLEPLRIGQTATRTSSVLGARVRLGRSGWLLIVTELHEVHVDGSLRVREERDMVYRRAEDVGRAPRSGPVAERAPSSGPELVADERLLFCFSALTYNAHRIHFDHPYATGVEGHPGLVVHGPLLVLAALEAAGGGAARGAAAVGYRLTAPVFAHEPVRFVSTPADGGATRVAGTSGGVTTVEVLLTPSAPSAP